MSKARFIEPMLLLRSDALPEGRDWVYELKLDGYRAIGYRSTGAAHLRSRNNKSFDDSYPGIVKALARLPEETVVDGEVVALDESGRPSFNRLQNYGSSSASLCYFLFDVLILKGRDLRGEPLETRRELLSRTVLPKLAEPIREAPQFDAPLKDLVRAIREQGLEGLVAKRIDSVYESGERSGAWRKMRVNQGQEFVIGGYTVDGRYFDALVFGYYEGSRLMYAGRTRNGFTPSLRAQLCERFSKLETAACPFANLPEKLAGRWGQGLTASKMEKCRWLKPVLVGQFEFVEWTTDGHLRHSRFIGLREDKSAQDVVREQDSR